MHIDARELDNNTLIEGDLCIIGAGAAGITIARELLGTPYKVILLESGGFEYDEQTQSLYEGKNIGLPYFSLKKARSRFFGGTTDRWAGMCAPLDPIDFEKRDWVPYSGWPISWQDLDPYYARAQKVCELGPYRYDTEFWEQQEPNLCLLPFDRSKISYKKFQYSPPTRFGTVYRETLLTANNIVLWTYANVTAIKTSTNAAMVTGVHIKCLNGKEHQVQAQYYVLACGGIENARLLLISNQTQLHGLGNQHDLVGRFFMEHIHIACARLIVSASSLWEQYLFRQESVPKIHFTLSEQAQRERKLLNCTFDLCGTDWEDVVLLKESEQLNEAADERFKEEIRLYLEALQACDNTFLMRKPERLKSLNNQVGLATSELILFSVIEQAPNPASRVILDREKDSLGLPKIQLDWCLTDLARQTAEEANQLVSYELGHLGLGRLQLLEWLTQEAHSWPEFPQVLRGSRHHMGTTRMSDNPKTGVVNLNCQVYGVSNLYVAGSSVYPTCGTANPTLTLVALAIRLADHLKGLLCQ